MARDFALFGLTGGVACGKSTVAGYFANLGASLISADGVAHDLLRARGAEYAEIVREFGPQVLDASGEIDRRRLGAIVFADQIKRLRLNAILHPSIIARQEEIACAIHRAQPDAVILVEAALIYEAGVEGFFTRILAAWCRPEQQAERLAAKLGGSRSGAQARIAAQMPAEEKRRRAHLVIDCSGTLEETRAQVEQLYPMLQRLADAFVAPSA